MMSQLEAKRSRHNGQAHEHENFVFLEVRVRAVHEAVNPQQSLERIVNRTW
jgi:hypothetical protein